jgi:predicted acetyltransferase
MITLQRPREELAASYLEFIAEMRQNGDKIWDSMIPKPDDTPAQFVQRLLRSEIEPAAGMVPETCYWACDDDQVVGRISLRHHLNDNLKELGGHIGYEVRPSRRGQGIAKEMLKNILQTAKAKEIGRLLLTCAPNNTASNKTILANGGVLAKTAFVEKLQRQTNYYWITI